MSIDAVAFVEDGFPLSQVATITTVYDVVWLRGSWRVRHIGKHSKPHADQEAAIQAAIASAKKAVAKTADNSITNVEVRLLRTDGQIIIHPLDGEKSPD
jgi:hypothetical protein